MEKRPQAMVRTRLLQIFSQLWVLHGFGERVFGDGEWVSGAGAVDGGDAAVFVGGGLEGFDFCHALGGGSGGEWSGGWRVGWVGGGEMGDLKRWEEEEWSGAGAGRVNRAEHDEG